MTDTETFEVIDVAMRKIMHRYGPDHRIDGHERLAEYAVGLIRAERERCARIAEGQHTKDDEDWDNNLGQNAWDSACDRIAARIRGGDR